MNQFMSQEQVGKIREQYPKGTRIELDYMDERDMPSGLLGTVRTVDDAGQIHMSWDNGRSLAIAPEVDEFHVVREKEETIKVLVVEPMKEPYEKEIENDYKAMQGIVNGCIEFVALPDGECHLYCNEEGRLEGLAGNRKMDNENIICGTFFICADNGEGDDASLSDKQMDYYKERFKQPEQYATNESDNFSYTIASANTPQELLKMMGILPPNDDMER